MINEVIKTFLQSLDVLANVYFLLWLISEYYIRSVMNYIKLPCMYKSTRYTLLNALACIALFIILFLPKALYQ